MTDSIEEDLLDREIVEKLKHLSQLEDHPKDNLEYKRVVKGLLQQLLRRNEIQRDTNESLEARCDEIEDECIGKDAEIIRISQEAQSALSKAARRHDEMQRDLEEQVVSLADQKSGLETIVRRLQKENTALKHENQLLRVTDRMPSLSARLVEVQGERDSYQREYQSLLIEVDLIKARREAELASIFGICNLFEKKIEEITANLQSTRDV